LILPQDWRTRDNNAQAAMQSAVPLVPSAILRKGFNILINPAGANRKPAPARKLLARICGAGVWRAEFRRPCETSDVSPRRGMR